MSEPSQPKAAPTAAVPQSTAPAVSIPNTSSPPIPASTGPIRTARKPKATPGPLPTRASERVPAITVRQAKVNTARSPAVGVSQLHASQVHPPQATALPPTEPNALIMATSPSDTASTTAMQDPNAALPPVVQDSDAAPLQAMDEDPDDDRSYTSTLPDIFDVGSDDSAPQATGPWMIIDHYTGEIIVDANQSTSPPPNAPTIPAVPTGLPGVEIAIAPHLGTAYLTETPATLLSEDEDVRPQWLLTAVNSFLRLVPCVGSLGKVIDLYLDQEARLGYPELVRTLVLLLCDF